MEAGRGGGAGDAEGQAVQVWATWFPREGKPETWIQGFSLESLCSNNVGLDKASADAASSNGAGLSNRGTSPFFLGIGENRIGENECSGRIEVGGQRIWWAFRIRSSFRAALSNKGWVGF